LQNERRTAPRARVNLPARWEGVLSRETATVTDISRNGCFVLSGGKVEKKELVWLEIQLPDQNPVHIWGEVVDEATDIGFAVRFNSASDEDEVTLSNFLEQVFQSAAKKTG
jgi:PilZ domain